MKKRLGKCFYTIIREMYEGMYTYTYYASVYDMQGKCTYIHNYVNVNVNVYMYMYVCYQKMRRSAENRKEEERTIEIFFSFYFCSYSCFSFDSYSSV